MLAVGFIPLLRNNYFYISSLFSFRNFKPIAKSTIEIGSIIISHLSLSIFTNTTSRNFTKRIMTMTSASTFFR